jgi:hypothetical protein
MDTERLSEQAGCGKSNGGTNLHSAACVAITVSVCQLRLPYTGACRVGDEHLVDRRIKPYFEEQAELESRAAQTRVFKRNQALGLVLVALVILVVWLFRANPAWLFPAGWWRP